MPGKKKKPPVFEHFATTIPVIRTCSRCGVWLAAALSEGLHVTVDLTPLHITQAMSAVLLRLELYCITRTGLLHMDPWRITEPPGELYAAHRCGHVWPRVTPGAGYRPKPPLSEIPPF